MTLIRKWVLVLCLAWLPLNYSNAQDLIPGQVYTTNNIVQQTQQGGPSTWTNGVYQNNLTCWTWGDPGYCGPNAIVRPGNNINFSFGQTDLYQSQAIAGVLPSATGLRVNGYNFSFTAKNGNGWDNGQTDYLYAYTHFTNQNNQVVSYNSYNLTNKFNWTTFNFSETFTTPFAANDLKNVTYGFVGRDSNGWAGPYGPEINNVNFSLKYSVDPCVSNPLYSPTCPGYLDAFNKLTPKTTTVAEPTAQQSTVVAEPAVISAVVQQPVTTATATATTSPVMAVVTPQATQKQSSQPSIGTLLSIITGVQSQVSRTERSVVQQAIQEATKQAEKATQDAESFSSKQNQQQQEQQQIQQNLQSTSVQQTFVNTIRQDFSLQPGNQNQRNNTSLASTSSSNVESFSQNLPQPVAIKSVEPQQVVSTVIPPVLVDQSQPQQTSSIYSLVPQSQQLQQSSIVVQPTYAATPLQQKIDLLPEISTEQKQVIGPTNPLEKFLGTIPNLDNVSNQPPPKPINQKAQDSELAGGVSIASIARQPQGFETYMAILQDVPFYKSTEIYRGQTTVDNQRAMRGLSGASDARHKELVDSQYRR